MNGKYGAKIVTHENINEKKMLQSKKVVLVSSLYQKDKQVEAERTASFFTLTQICSITPLR